MKGLLVDDSAPDRVLAREMMQACRPAWRFQEASEAGGVLALLREDPADFVLLDVNMCPEDGFQILQLVRHEPAAEGVRVFMHSTSDMESHRVEAERLGADGYVAKPASMQEYEQVCRMLERTVGTGVVEFTVARAAG